MSITPCKGAVADENCAQTRTNKTRPATASRNTLFGCARLLELHPGILHPRHVRLRRVSFDNEEDDEVERRWLLSVEGKWSSLWASPLSRSS